MQSQTDPLMNLGPQAPQGWTQLKQTEHALPVYPHSINKTQHEAILSNYRRRNIYHNIHQQGY